MKLPFEGFNASSGDPIPLDRLIRMHLTGANIIRTWIGPEQNREINKYQFTLVPELQPLWIILKDPIGEINAVPDGSWVTLGNEPNIGRDLPVMNPHEYADFYGPAYYIARDRGLKCYVGELSAISSESMLWLEELLTIWSDVTHVAQHRYALKDDQDPMKSSYHGGRNGEMADFNQVIQARNYLITELGPKEISYTDWKPPFRHHVSQDDRLRFAKQDRDFWRNQPNCEGIIYYQEWTGNPPTDPYGMFGPNFEVLPILDVFKD